MVGEYLASCMIYGRHQIENVYRREELFHDPDERETGPKVIKDAWSAVDNQGSEGYLTNRGEHTLRCHRGSY